MKFSAILVPAIVATCIAATPLAANADPPLADSVCPAVGTSNGCDSLIYVDLEPGVTVSTMTPYSATGPYDAYGDQLIGVYNDTDSNHTIYGFTLSSYSDIFGFGGNGIDGYDGDGVTADGSNPDTTGYGGPDAYFTGITGDATDFPEVGTVYFANGGIPFGGTDYFSLSAPLEFSMQPIPIFDPPPAIPEPASMTLLGLGLVATGVSRRFRR